MKRFESNTKKALVDDAGGRAARGLSEDPGWQARLSLQFESRNNRTLLTRRRHEGPLMVQRPFYPEDAVCHVYLIHPPGGVVGGDILEINVNCESRSEALITGPAAAKFYRSNGPTATQTTRIRVAEDAVIEWLPQESILFDHARVKSLTRFDLASQSTLIGWEIVCLGRPACSEGFLHGRAEIGMEVWRDGRPLLVEKMLLDSETMQRSCGMNRHAAVATMLLYPAGKEQTEQVRTLASEQRAFGATLIDGLLVCRMLGSQAEPVRKLFSSIWVALRPAITRRKACPPRVWAT